MKIARGLSIRTGALRSVSAIERLSEIQKAQETGMPLSEEHFFAARHGDPLTFRRSGKLSAHWARSKGYGLNHSNRAIRQRQGKAAFRQGTKTLLMLDNIFGYKERPYDFSHITRSNKAWPLADWIFANNANFQAVPTPSLTVAIDEIRKLSANLEGSGRELKDMCFAQYGGAVLPYSQFFMNGHLERLEVLDNDLRAQKNTVNVRSDDEQGLEVDRRIGLPRIFKFSATQSTKDEKGRRGLKGNRIALHGKDEATLISALRPAQASVRQSGMFQAVRRLVIQGNDVFVLATPRITVDPEDLSPEEIEGLSDTLLGDGHAWRMLGWNINDAEKQIVPVGAASGASEPLMPLAR